MAEDYKALARKAAEQEGVDPELFSRLVNQESRFNPAAVSPKGAVGLSQLLPSTAKDLGVNPNDPWENLVGGARYLARGLKASGGDVPTALAYYNAGPGNVQKYGGVPPFAETLDYIQKITGAAVEPSRGRGAGAGRGVAGTAAQRGDYADAAQVALSYNSRASKPGIIDAALRTENFQNQIAADTKPSLLEMFGAGLAGNGDASLVQGIQHTFGQEQYVADPNFKPDMTRPEVVADRDFFNQIALSRNAKEYQDLLDRHMNDQARSAAIMSRGGVVGTAIMLGTELTAVSNWAPAVGAYKAMSLAKIGSAALAAEGRVGASVASAVGENILGGTAVEATRQGLNNEFKPVDLFASAALDTMFGLGFGAAGVRSASKAAAIARQEESIAKATSIAVEQEVAREAAARAKLGPDATLEQIKAEMDRAHLDEIARPINQALSDAPAERLLMNEQTDWSKVDTGVAVEKAAVDSAGLPTVGKSYEGYLGKEAFVERRARLGAGGDAEPKIAEYTSGKYTTLAELEALPAGIHTTGLAGGNPEKIVKLANKLASKFLGPDFRMLLDIGDAGAARGKVLQATENVAMVKLSKDLDPLQMARTLAHEIGHMIYNVRLNKLSTDELAKLDNAYNNFLKVASKQDGLGNEARGQRFSLLSTDLQPGRKEALPLDTGSKYHMSRHEFSAEQFVKYLEEDVATENKLGIAKDTVKMFKEAIIKALEWLRLAKRENIGITDEYKEFFDNVLQGKIMPKVNEDVLPVKRPGAPLEQADKTGDAVNSFMANPDAIRLGLTNLPMGTATERAEAASMLQLHLKAEKWAVANPMDEKWMARAKHLTSNSTFSSIGLNMLSSPSPLVRMVASTLLEDASGVAGRRHDTAAIAKYMYERTIMGNTKNDLSMAYEFWKKQRGFGIKDDIWGGNNWAQFNKEVALEIEARRGSNGKAVSQDGNVVAAADSFQAAMDRSRTLQQRFGTLGSEGLGNTSAGYMPHLMSPKKVLALSNEERATLQAALADQYVTLSGWDISFSDNLAATVVERMRRRAAGGYATPTGGSSTEVLEEAMKEMNLSGPEVISRLKALESGAASHTKKRIELDLTQVLTTPSGKELRLIDVFDTDMASLLEHQTRRVSGEVALTKYGVNGRPGLQLLRKAIEQGEDGKKATLRDQESFDQMAAEFLGQPFGTHMGKWMERAMTANAVVRLGGIVYNQFAEFINGVFHVGAARTFESVASIPRLRSEIIAKSKGQHVENPILDSIELVGGAEFGTDAYKVVMPFDNPTHDLPAYGRDTVTSLDRILRGAGHVQSVLSGWRAIHSAQQRGMAEQIVHKALRYINEGKDDIALRQFGINEEVQKAMKADLANIAEFDNAGRLVKLDITKMTDASAQEQFIQAVHRGTMQIIQGTFIGERGKWAHDGLLKAMTQFRSFSLVSMEKQWGRQRNDRGSFAAAGMILGSMSLAAPIYMARVYANSVGREDQQDYLDKMLRPQMIARATLNYIAASGMAGDFIDLTASVLPDKWDIRPTGGRPGQASDFVGTYILPASSLINDGYKYLQQIDNLHNAAKLLPGSRLPYVLPLVNTVPDYSKD